MSRLVLILILAVTMISVLGCGNGHTNPTALPQPDKAKLVISLLDTGETVLSDIEMQGYNATENAFELNDDGIRKWNSYLPSQTPPKLQDTLFSREFVLKIDGNELCRGKFYSNVSSASYSGIVILDALFRLDSEHSLLWVRSSYPSAADSLEPSVSSELVRFFEQRGHSR